MSNKAGIQLESRARSWKALSREVRDGVIDACHRDGGCWKPRAVALYVSVQLIGRCQDRSLLQLKEWFQANGIAYDIALWDAPTHRMSVD